MTNYHPALSQKAFKIFQNNHSILTSREDHKVLFDKVPMISFRRAKSLHDFLVRAVVKPLSEETSECTGCGGRSDCEVCKNLKKGSKFYSKEKKSYDIRKGKLHCNTPLCIYLMSCNFCQNNMSVNQSPSLELDTTIIKPSFENITTR